MLNWFVRPEKEIILNIAGNNRLRKVQRLTGEDFWLLSKVLRNRSLIIGLDVRYNLISDVGAYYAAKLLQKQPHLTYLNLMFNDIGPDGGELIAKALHVSIDIPQSSILPVNFNFL
ncbi:leucine-rich repeat-containing protein 34 [Cricetulus griseus]|uniref:Leucine-rich repeat-containing protein 34 n=1 Tax=Cricetulus griseus TaxID=10029 RepID=A0A061IM91_CRIGR|nr:leucine-rich repeat-containing protein 34 [Cricetulus griseus]